VVDGRIIGDRRAAVLAHARTPFDLARSLEYAVRALPSGSSLLLIGDGLDVSEGDATTDLLARAGRRFDATVLLASDPWIDGLPLRGLVRLRDVETGAIRRVLVNANLRARYVAASRARDAALRERFARARWRVGVLDEADGRASLERTFGLR
jgi:hypothetical protein